MKKNNSKGAPGFDDFYAPVFGDRWLSIKESFSMEPDYLEIGPPLVSPYYIDSASRYPAAALDVRPGMNVLDMCAAPGGKTLLLAIACGPGGSLTANDRSAERRNRLIKVLDECLPPQLRSCVKVTGHDASLWGMHEKNTYDRILLDAPCSSERHVYLSPPHLASWSPARSRQLAQRQYAMLAAALDAAREGGRIVYSTCSVSPLENDLNIEKLLRKRKGMLALEQSLSADLLSPDNRCGVPEKTAYGFQILPDAAGGAGPIYFAVILKL